MHYKNIKLIQIAFKKIFNKNQSIIQNLKTIDSDEMKILEIKEIIKFVKENHKRGICTI